MRSRHYREASHYLLVRLPFVALAVHETGLSLSLCVLTARVKQCELYYELRTIPDLESTREAVCYRKERNKEGKKEKENMAHFVKRTMKGNYDGGATSMMSAHASRT